MTTPTKLPIPSNNLLDARFNFEKLDQIVNSDASYYLDRFGKQRLTAKGLEDLINRIEGEFETNVGLPDGFKLIGKCPDVTALRTIEPSSSGQQIYLVSYDSDWASDLSAPQGGGVLYYDKADTTSPDDGVLVFVTPTGKRWKRLIEGNRIPISFAGIKGDGITDETTKFHALISTLSNYSEYYVINGNSKTILKSQSTKIDLVKVGLEDIILQDNTTNISVTPYYILQVDGTQLAGRKHKGRQIVFDKVEVSGGNSRGSLSGVLQNVNGVLFKPTSDLSGIRTNDCQIKNVNIAVVFSNNCYLMTFNNWVINSCHLGLGTTLYTGEQSTTLNNAGENLRFNGGVISDSNMIGRLKGLECFFTFFETSFDYTGGPVGVNYVQWADFRQGTELQFTGCHFESGNANDCWTDNFFYVDTSVGISIDGGAMRHSATNNNCPYFFYDAGTYGQFSIVKTDIWGAGVRTWSNRGMLSFFPMINVESSQVRGYLSERSLLLVDPTFSKGTGTTALDNWQVLGGTRTGAIVSSLLSCSHTTVTDSTGTSFSALKITKLASGTNCIIRLYIRSPKTNFSPHGSLKIHSASTIDLSASPCSLSVGFLKTSLVIDSYGKPTDLSALSKVTTNITAINNTMTRVDARGALTQSDDYLGYDYIFMSLNLGNLPVGSEINITDANLEIPFK